MKEEETERSCPLFYSPNASNSWDWTLVRANARGRTLPSGSPMWVPGTQLLSHHHCSPGSD